MSRKPDTTAVMAFTDDQVLRLTGLSKRQLHYWRNTGFFEPSFGERAHFYSFRDLVGLRTIALLRKEQVPLQELRKIGEWLREKHATPWASLTFHLFGRTVFVEDPRTGARESRRGQQGIPYPMKRIANETLEAVKKDRSRKASDMGKVERRRGVMGRQPVIAGTRIKTSSIWELHDEGVSVEDIIAQYPSLTAEDVRAAISHERQSRRKAG